MKILRSINLPSDLDEALRVLAFHQGLSKQDLIIKLLEQGVEHNRSLLDRMAPGLLPKSIS